MTGTASIDPAILGVIDELNEIVRADGAQLILRAAEGTVVELALDLSASSCPECVVPKELLIEIAQSRLEEVSPDVRRVLLDDPREDESFTPGVH